jgi:hypothetical protein
MNSLDNKRKDLEAINKVLTMIPYLFIICVCMHMCALSTNASLCRMMKFQPVRIPISEFTDEDGQPLLVIVKVTGDGPNR